MSSNLNHFLLLNWAEGFHLRMTDYLWFEVVHLFIYILLFVCLLCATAVFRVWIIRYFFAVFSKLDTALCLIYGRSMFNK